MAGLLIKDLPRDVHDWLKRAAETNRRSLTQQVIVLLICLLAMGGCVSGPVPALPAVHAPLSLQDCEAVRIGMTEVEVYGLIGRPNHNAGSGIAYDIYDLPDGSSVWMAWQAGRVSWLFRQDSGGIRKPLGNEPKAMDSPTNKIAPTSAEPCSLLSKAIIAQLSSAVFFKLRLLLL